MPVSPSKTPHHTTTLLYTEPSPGVYASARTGICKGGAICLLAFLMMGLPGCSSFPLMSGFGGTAQQGEAVEQEADSGAGPVTTERLIWLTGAAMAVIGGLMLLSWLASFQLPVLAKVPDGAGVLALAGGIAVMGLADLMAAHWWITPLILAAVVLVGIIEYIDHDAWLRKWTRKDSD